MDHRVYAENRYKPCVFLIWLSGGMADTQDLKSCERKARAGSTPASATEKIRVKRLSGESLGAERKKTTPEATPGDQRCRV